MSLISIGSVRRTVQLFLVPTSLYSSWFGPLRGDLKEFGVPGILSSLAKF